MLNQVILVGRLTREVKVEKEEDQKYAILQLAIPRSYKNSEGFYDTDFVDCKIFDSVATNTSEYCKKGDILGIKGRIQTEKVDDKYVTNIIGEKVTFLSSSKNEG